MKVIIITEGYQSTGYGHITRCLSLYQAFQQKKINPIFIINGDEGAKPFLGEADYIFMDWLNNTGLLLEHTSSSDIIIVDSYKAGAEFYSLLYENTKLLAVIDDFLRIDYKAHVIINGTIGAEEFPYKKEQEVKYLLGAEYLPIRKEFGDVQEKKISSWIESVLITFGGQDVRCLTGKILDYLAEKEPDLKYHIVARKNLNLDFEKYTASRNIFFVFDADSGEMKNLMLKCDIAITAAGQTIYELARVGVPSIAVIVAENQVKNLQEWIKNGFIADELYYDDPDLLPKISAGISKLNRKFIRSDLSRRGRATIDGQGALRITDFLTDAAPGPFSFHSRIARQEDAKLVFDLSNDLKVRKNSINQKPIEWDDHIEWYNSKLLDENYFFHLHFTEKNEFIGQVRFNIDNDSAVISISIVKEFRGFGLSSKLLKESCAELFRKYHSVNKITAFIKKENSASIKGFINAGFIPSGDEIIDGDYYNSYILVR